MWVRSRRKTPGEVPGVFGGGCSSGLELVLESELDLTRIVVRAGGGELSELAALDIVGIARARGNLQAGVRSGVVGGVGDVESFGAELERRLPVEREGLE